MLSGALLSAVLTLTSASDTTIKSVDTMVVTALRLPKTEHLQVAAEQRISGLTDNINRILYLQPGVDRVPEAGSTILINGAGPYDNAYYVYGIPMFAPSHFTNHSFADRSGTIVSSLKSVGLATSNLSGRYPEATGGVVELKPEIYRPADTLLLRRPEFAVGVGSLDVDLQLSRPSRLRRGDFYEVSWKQAWPYNIAWLNGDHLIGVSTSDAQLGNGIPFAYGDVVASASNRSPKVHTRELLWFAYDSYMTGIPCPVQPFLPWGCAALNVEVNDPDVFIQEGGVGATHQVVYEGKRVGSAIPLKTVSRTGGSAFVRTGIRQIGRLAIRGSTRLDGLSWWGTCVERETNTHLRSVRGNELVVSLQGEATHSIGALIYGLNLLGVVAGTPVVGYVDPGVFLRLNWSKVGVEIDGGISSSRPDIRGLPQPEYRGTIDRTYGGSAALRLSPRPWTSLAALGCIRYSDSRPQMSDTATFLWWNPSGATPVLSRSINLQWDLRLKDVATLRVVQNLNKSRRELPAGAQVYEWDLPWSSKAMLGFKMFGGLGKLFVTGQVSSGLPYRKVHQASGVPVYDDRYHRAIVYKRVDAKAQFGQPTHGHRYLTRYDAYVDVTNVFGWVNAREYYWDPDMAQHPILLQPRLVSLGLRLGFRL